MKIISNKFKIKEKLMLPANVLWKIYALITVMTCGLYAFLTSLRTMPFAEGWYTYYAQCINNGERTYKDFDYLFTPLYINLVALFTRLFGYKIIYLRLLGVVFFCLIAVLLFLIIKEIFNYRIAAIVTIPTMMYLQSEVVQVFYDYVRLMDIMAVATLLYIIKYIKELNGDNEKKKRNYLLVAGVTNSAFILIKQNMGIVYGAYIIILLLAINIVKRIGKREGVKYIGYFGLGLIVPIIFTVIIMLLNGSLFCFMSQTGSDAIAAKGGVVAILFGWLVNNADTFLDQLLPAIITMMVLVILNMKSKASATSYLEDYRVEMVYNVAMILPILSILGFILLHSKESFARLFGAVSYLSPYYLYLIVAPIFWIYVIKVILIRIKKETIETQDLLYIAISGAYFAISWGCGMSSGLAEGQATFGLAFLLAYILKKCDFRYGIILKIVVCGCCLFMTMQYSSKKMINTYSWWGMTDSDYWSSIEVSDDIPVLQGIKMSESTLNVYEEIYHLVQNETSEDDYIYCFPQIPIFYSVCDRIDPGVRAKVQWFDVASDASINNDITVLEDNPPSVIIIYETSEYAYNSHEHLFRGGEISATRKMKRFLLDYVSKNGYELYKEINENDKDKFLVYYKTDDTESASYSGLKGEGTVDNPYLVSSADDLLYISQSVSMGNDYAKVYFEQTCDIDLSTIENWEPIGRNDDYGLFGFNGIYNGNGFSIKNINSVNVESDVALFSNLYGIVVNLCIEDSYFEGDSAAAIAIGEGEEDAVVANCIVRNSTIKGVNAAAIANGFKGSVYNCYINSRIYGIKAELVNLEDVKGGKCENIYLNGDNVLVPASQVSEDDIAFYDDTLLRNSMRMVREYNTWVSKKEEFIDELENVELLYWNVSDDEPTLISSISLEGHGTEKKPFLINDADDFAVFRDMVNSGITFDGAFIKQTADIDLKDEGNFDPVGYDLNCAFNGIYNGAGYSINNVYILSDNNENMALFRYLNGTVINLNVKNAWVGGSCVAIIAGEGEGQVINCYASGILYGFSTSGIAFKIDSVSNCVSLVTVDKGTDISGISSRAVVDNCFSNIVLDGNPGVEVYGDSSIAKLNDYISSNPEYSESIPYCQWENVDGEIRVYEGSE
ncbi:ArnT family glycosyltransferase [Pseudobutyrivibrio sp.]|uniref:ArnT family glycosyltransferase n=1 Tax=Pseudobutyrivibrio sp. TaxID=2014367 RepID=UPI001DA06EF5|nr:glycosyltransferase family 39 protein [Pseudobutyrivibrio sp.]MBE5910053.1 glycosyltransferase family 39 protein [Pseudobutyrivibrio sp.]